ncbi:MAG: glycosyltransferase family 2 protein [Bacteroidales bacterium]|jgi:glycosyltransferase involved in cell wall biosynthesis|nr:glycosyltransferase family 2 protein [Bacteroidales bacterium]
MDQIAVLIPCYNESVTIAKVVEDFKRILPEAAIYVYDNNSTDATAGIAGNAGAIVRKESKQGKGNVIRSMFRDIDAECYVLVDGDDTYSAEHVREMIHAVLHDRMDMVIGDRLTGAYFTENKRPMHNTGNKMVRQLINSIFKSDVRDVMTGYRALGYHFVKTFPVLSTGFEIETEMTIHALDKNLYLKSIPVDYRDRAPDSISKLNTYRDGARVLKTIFYLYKDYRPFSFFKRTSAVLFVAGMLFLYPVLRDYLHSGLVPRFPTFIAGCVFFLAALQSFSIGLILDNHVKSRRQRFEIEYTNSVRMYTSVMK